MTQMCLQLFKKKELLKNLITVKLKDAIAGNLNFIGSYCIRVCFYLCMIISYVVNFSQIKSFVFRKQKM